MTIKIMIMNALLLLVCGSFRLRHVADKTDAAKEALRAKLIAIAEKEVGVREKTGRNDGPRIQEYLSVVKLKSGDPYCAAFVSWAYACAGLAEPRSGWSPSLFPASRLTKSPAAADVFGIYFVALKRIAHVGLVVKINGDWVETLEGNTNLAGSREGVYRKKRHIKTIRAFADWVSERRKLP